MAKIEIVKGCEGMSLYINDTRVAGNKPYGGGMTIAEFKVPDEEILRQMGYPEIKEIAEVLSK